MALRAWTRGSAFAALEEQHADFIANGKSVDLPGGDSKVSVTRGGDTLTQKSCYPVYSPFGIEGSTRADPLVGDGRTFALVRASR